MLSSKALWLCAVATACVWARGCECRGGRQASAPAGGSPGRRPTPTAHASTAAPAPAVGLRGYRRFHANDSLVGRPVPCTRDEKICLRHNLIFYPPRNKCLSLEDDRITTCANLAVDRQELESGSRHVVASCQAGQKDRCYGVRMAYDDGCYRKDAVRDVLCGCSAPLTAHPLGGLECRCSPGPSRRVTQPKQNGRCVFPDLLSPYADQPSLLTVHPNVSVLQCSNAHCYAPSTKPPPKCTNEQRQCFEQGKVWLAARRHCFPLLGQLPCERNYHLVLSKNKTFGHMVFCRHVRGDCPPGQIRMAFDDRCHDEREMNMISPGYLQKNVFGDYIIPRGVDVSFKPVVSSGHCEIKFEIFNSSIGRPLGNPIPPCGMNNSGDCMVEVYAELPAPLDDF